MAAARRDRPGLMLGAIVLGLVAMGFVGLFVFGPPRTPAVEDPAHEAKADLLEVLTDAPTKEAVTALKAVSPATYAELDAVSRRTITDGADAQAVSELVLEALFAQFRDQAYHLQFASSEDYQLVVARLATGLNQLDEAGSPWCEGPRVAQFLAQNEAALVPTLLAEFPYGSPQYDWAMGWMQTVLEVSARSRAAPRRYANPTDRDELVLQEHGLALGSQQWGLALQVAAFANAEGVSYARMQEVIAGMDVCELGLAVETVSAGLPADVRARIWSDLLPEIFVGNTPYVMWRVNDYFFIG